MSKTVFIDYDGTFADRGWVPEAHFAAVREARRNGHRVLLCTGRPKAMLPDRILSTVFDGLVAAAGGYVEIDGTILADTRFPEDLAARAVSVLTSYDVAFILEAPQALYGPPGIRGRMREILSQAFGSANPPDAVSDILSPLRATSHLSSQSFGKVSVFSSPIPVDELAKLIGPLVGALPHSVADVRDHGGEIYLRGVNKAIGMELVSAHLGIRRRDIIGVGDGYNDLEMLSHAGTAVVVEGAPADVLALADLVVAPPERAGLVQGFQELGLTIGGSPRQA